MKSLSFGQLGELNAAMCRATAGVVEMFDGDDVQHVIDHQQSQLSAKLRGVLPKVFAELRAERSVLATIRSLEFSAIDQSFVVADHFQKNTSKNAVVQIAYIGENFRSWFSDQEVAARIEYSGKVSNLVKQAKDEEIILALGQVFETDLAVVWELLKLQSRGEKGILLTNGYANIFYVKDVKGLLRAVLVHWLGVGWVVGAVSVDSPNPWYVGIQVLSCNS